MALVEYEDGSRIIENVPICYQGNTNTCAQACITSVLNYWGHNVKYEDIIADTCGNNMVGMTIERMMWYFRKYNLKSISYGGNLAKLKALIDKGYPTIVSFDEESYYHVVVVIGYNDYREVIYYIDSEDGDIMEESYYDFIRAWGKQRRVFGFGDLQIPNLMLEVRP
jgi:ABC-type bacteriocin/lantibiotic exporter with double-glycine peptidase domain